MLFSPPLSDDPRAGFLKKKYCSPVGGQGKKKPQVTGEPPAAQERRYENPVTGKSLTAR